MIQGFRNEAFVKGLSNAAQFLVDNLNNIICLMTKNEEV